MLFFIVLFGVLAFLYLLQYISEKMIWVMENRIYIVKLIEKQSKRLVSESMERHLEEFEDITEQQKRETFRTAYAVIFSGIYKSLKMKKLFFVILNPFTNNIVHLVRNKEVLISLLDQDK